MLLVAVPGFPGQPQWHRRVVVLGFPVQLPLPWMAVLGILVQLPGYRRRVRQHLLLRVLVVPRVVARPLLSLVVVPGFPGQPQRLRRVVVLGPPVQPPRKMCLSLSPWNRPCCLMWP